VVDSWDWCLANWEKFQYMQMVNGAIEAGQVPPPGASGPTREVWDGAAEQIRLGRSYGLIRDLPDDLLVAIGSTVSLTISSHLHAHPEARQDPGFMDRAWAAWWSTLADHA
jgi:hypothetical protein